MDHKPHIAPLDERILDPQATAQWLGVTKKTVYNLMRRGEIEGFRIGKSRRITETELWEYVNRQRAKEQKSA